MRIRITTLVVCVGLMISIVGPGSTDVQLDKEQIKAHPVFSKFLEKAKKGAMKMKEVPKVTDPFMARQVRIQESGKVRVRKPEKKKWDESTVPHIQDAMAEYLANTKVQIKPKKAKKIEEHLEQFAAFKANVYSSFEPGPELGKVVGVTVGRGVRWAFSDDAPSLSEEETEQAKKQVQEIFDWVEWMLCKVVPEDIQYMVHEEKKECLEQFMERVESPFFVDGKKVFTPAKIKELRGKSYAALKKRCLGENDTFLLPELPDFAPQRFVEAQQRSFISRIFVDCYMPFFGAYTDGTRRDVYDEETSKASKMFKKIVKDKLGIEFPRDQLKKSLKKKGEQE